MCVNCAAWFLWWGLVRFGIVSVASVYGGLCEVAGVEVG